MCKRHPLLPIGMLCVSFLWPALTAPVQAADCDGNGIEDACDLACGEPGGPCDVEGCGQAADCNANAIPDACDIAAAEAACRFPTVLSQNTTTAADSTYIGPPDDVFWGLGGQVVTYRFDCLLVDGAGADLTVYEVDSGGAEFGNIDVLVSADGITFTSVKSSESPAVRIPGDEAYVYLSFARSYDLAAAGLSHARYVQIDGAGTGASGSSTGFDLDAIGAIHITADCDGDGVPNDCELPPGGPDCNLNTIPDSCEPDCNANGVPDDCDLDPTDPDGNSQVSLDCDNNQRPDECDPDCDGDGLPDACAIASGLSADCNRNGIPDTCDLDAADPDGNGQVSGDCNLDGVPDECPLCPNVEIVFIMDVSTSMNDEGAALCNSISQIVTSLAARGLTIDAKLLGISSTPSGIYSCLTDNVINRFGTVVPGAPPAGNETLGACPGGDQVASEDWGRAVSVVAGWNAWASDSIRLIVPLSDEGPWCGDPVTDPGVDRDSITHAITIANQNDVVVSPITGTGSSTAVIRLAELLAQGTGGLHFSSTDPNNDIATGIENIILEACRDRVDCNRNLIPDLCDLNPADPDGNGQVSADCNANLRPDECEPDCNTNSVPDDCDIDPADPDGDGWVSRNCNANARPDECEPDCNANGVPDDCDVDPADPDGNTMVSADCGGEGIPDECQAGIAPAICRFPATLVDNTTGAPDDRFTGPPDDAYYGLGGQIVTYRLDCFLFDAPGPDLTVYEVDSGSAEFSAIDVLVSADGIAFTSIDHTQSTAVRIPGDEMHGVNAFARSYDISVADLPWVRFVRIDGAGTGAAGTSTGFDLDALGIIHVPLDCNINGVPDACEPDADGDTVIDVCDNCILDANAFQYDTDADGVGDACDDCPNTIPGIAVDERGCPPRVPGDFDRDGDVDMTDFGHFRLCATGPEMSPADTACMDAKLDGDADVDGDDFGVFQRCFSGTNNPGDPHCNDG